MQQKWHLPFPGSVDRNGGGLAVGAGCCGQKWWGPGCSGQVLPSSVTAAARREAGVTEERMCSCEHLVLIQWSRAAKNNLNATGWWVQSRLLSFHS